MYCLYTTPRLVVRRRKLHCSTAGRSHPEMLPEDCPSDMSIFITFQEKDVVHMQKSSCKLPGLREIAEQADARLPINQQQQATRVPTRFVVPARWGPPRRGLGLCKGIVILLLLLLTLILYAALVRLRASGECIWGEALSCEIIDHLNWQRRPPILERVEIARWHLCLLIAGHCCTGRACVALQQCMRLTAYLQQSDRLNHLRLTGSHDLACGIIGFP